MICAGNSEAVRAWRVDVAGDHDAAAARLAVRAAMKGRGDDAVHAAELVAGELVTNALFHGGGFARVTVTAIDDGVRIEVEDATRHAPLVAVPASDAMTGRGLHLVARLARATGVVQTTAGKVVWAEVTDPATVDDPRSADEILAGWDDIPAVNARGDVLRITLGDVPTTLLVEAKRHVDNLVREFALVEGGDRTGTTGSVPAPLAELINRVVHAFGDARREIKRQATEAARTGAPRTLLTLELRVEAAAAAREYLDALDEADAYARANRLLTLETPPQHRAFRRWYIGQLVTQLDAVRQGRERPPTVSFEQWLLNEFDAAERAREAADRTAQLYRVAVALAAAATPEEVSAAVLREGVEALHASGGGVLLATDASVLTVPGTVGYDERTVEKLRLESPDAELPAAHALRTGEPVWLESVEDRDARFPALRGLEPDTVSMCAVPLIAGGESIGALRFSFTTARLFGEHEQQFVLVLAAEAAEAMQRARLLASEREARERLEHERQSLEKVAAVGEAMLRRRDLDAILQLTTDAATQITGAAYGAFFYSAPNDRGDQDHMYTLTGIPLDAFAGAPVPRDAAVFASMFGNETIRLDDATTDPRFGADAPYFGLPPRRIPVRSYLAVPVTLSNGETVGGMLFAHPEAGRFGPAAERLANGLAGQASAAIETVRSLEERARVASALQQSLLPADLPEIAGVDLGAVYSAAGHGVGGDFYDVFALGPRRWGVAVGDVRGRGPEAAAVTALARYTIRAVSMLERDPADVVAVLDHAIRERDDERFCTAIFGVLELAGGGATFTYVNAGHPAFALLGTAGDVEFVGPTGPLVGALPGATWQQRTIALPAGASLVLFTDGISEARSGGEQFGDAALVEVLAEFAGSTAPAIAAAVAERARRFAGDAPTDDAAVFVVRVR